jgi:peroxiredoxin Q/BCP
MYGNISWGIERSTFVIDKNGQISRVFRRVQVDGHTDEVLEALRAMAA